MCRRIHDFGRFEDPMFPTNGFAAAPTSAIVYAGETGHRDIDASTHVPSFAPCPTAIENPIGVSFA
jgi:hypothetical protein